MTEKEQVLIWQKHFFKVATIIGYLLLGFGLLWLCSLFQQVCSIVGYAILLSYILVGPVDWLQKKTPLKGRLFPVALVYISVVTLLVGFVILVTPKLAVQLKILAHEAPGYLDRLEELLLNIPGLRDLGVSSEFLSREKFAELLRESFDTLALRLLQFATGTFSFMLFAFASLVLSVYFLIDGPRLWRGVSQLCSPRYLRDLHNLRHELDRNLRAYFIGQVQLASLSGVFVFAMYSSMGSSFALLLGIWQALVEIIPVVGGLIGILSGVIVLLLTQQNPWLALIAFVVYMIYTQLFKDNFLTPRIIGNAIGLHPVVVLLVVIMGAELAGVNGAVFALPLAGIVNVMGGFILSRAAKRQSHELNQ